MVKEYGSFIISLDFELFWGVRDKLSKNAYRENILGAKKIIPILLELFEKYDVHVTFAAVGLLFCRTKDEINRYAPIIKPSYSNSNLSPYNKNYLDSVAEVNDELHSAYDIIMQMKQYKNIEIATHTFSHYYCCEEGQTKDEFEADLISAINIASDNEVQLQSIVFPRNQISSECLNICYQHGIRVYRGNPKKYFGTQKKYKNRIMRFLDSYFPLGNDTTYGYEEIENEGMFNVKASRFLRPYSNKFELLENMKIKRIKEEMNYAAKNKRIYHLWWHPHNFGINRDKNIKMLEEILQHYKKLSEQYGFRSLNMNEIASLLKQNKIN